ncbi:glycosyl hydrolase 115 family protein [Bacteroides sp. 224]|uniref:glycosyl hydrolase 115 family protein n=1 Tax=Bacteroides sp. 224 TaxID=2302936 RepID=UPI0013D156F0|nr:glycosyl hydrolase 115 family protein [Bacteroides sp. 224]NDV64713.1 hypothetical protein [Bacteroides sp. 224]
MRIIAVLCISLMVSMQAFASFSFQQGKDIKVVVNSNEEKVVHTALALFQKDYSNVFDANLTISNKRGSLYVGTLGLKSKAENLVGKEAVEELKDHHHGFLITVKKGNLIVLGNDKQGTAYGVLELSRKIGVSPWIWWADSPVAKKENLTLEEGYKQLDYPAVAHRGIFINDEDWGLCPWSWKTNEPSTQEGRIGPQTHERIFELLLRLRANIFWPAMHECSLPFFLIEGNREVADRYGITIGTSHCEPMQRNTNGEWKVAGVGQYDYVKNAANVYKFWEERVKEVAHSNNYFTLGIRGVHDSKMLGANTIEEQRSVLKQVLQDQRELIAKYMNNDVTKVPQVFIPYKEVLDIYRSGLQVPDDVTLMWCDDNYGYIKYLPNEAEQNRKGGNGIYYHLSYWGRPHDYLWLATTSPALIRTELKRAYDYNVRQLWVINIGDIKPGEYLLEYTLDMAWDKEVLFNTNSNEHLKNWLSREFGADMATKLLPLWNEYYALSYRCRPEFMGNTRTEEKNPIYKQVKDLPWADSEVKERLAICHEMEKQLLQLSSTIEESKRAHWYQLVEYPIRSFCAMNRKMLGGQLARHGEAPWQDAVKGYDDIVNMTKEYNSMLDGKWNYIMDYHPRNLPVFEPLNTTLKSVPLPEYEDQKWILKPSDGIFGNASYKVNELGYSREALVLGEKDVFSASLPASTDSLTVTFAFVPSHPIGSDKLQVKVEVEGESPKLLNYETYGRSEEWKVNVLYNRATRTIMLPPSSTQRKIQVQAMTPAVILDEITIKATK